ncbi:MAG: dipeptide/oligopeptide/nickel ABC transporter ATP-binding protein, partial [Firmicutes bacterium HGW-Firmicutes-13]
RLSPIKGMMPDPSIIPEGCVFRPRCPYAENICAVKAPHTTEREGRKVMCLMHEGIIPNKMGVEHA